MEYTTLLTETRGSTLIVTINRPEAMNSLNDTVIEELYHLFTEFQSSAEWKGAILTGAGEKAFVAGADIAGVHNLPAGAEIALSRKGQLVFAAIENSSKPVIAAVNGFALGGGCELAMSCHLRIASEKAKFGQPEVNLGLIAGYGGTQRLPRLIGLGKATELLITGDMLKADEALGLGLVNHVTPAIDLIPKCLEILEKIYTKSPLAVGLTLKAIYAGVITPEHGYEVEAQAFGQAAASYDGKEGTKAFLEKRKPEFEGR